jgi:hypothetical protein
MDPRAIPQNGLSLSATAAQRDAPLARAAAEFERMVLGQLLRDLTAGTLPGGEASSPFASLLQDAYAAAIADRSELGIAESLLSSLRNAGGRL